MSIFTGNEQQPDFKFNNPFPAADNIKKTIGTPHATSLIALSLLEEKTADLHIEISYADHYKYSLFLQELLAIWETYRPISSFIRSFKEKSEYLTFFGNNQLNQSPSQPNSVLDYKNRSAIIDIEHQVKQTDSLELLDEYTFIIYRLNNGARRLTVQCTGQSLD